MMSTEADDFLSSVDGTVVEQSSSTIFYTQDSIARVFYNGKPVRSENIVKSWGPMVITEYKGQWFTLNNRTLLAHRRCHWADDEGNETYLVDVVVKVKRVPYELVKAEFHQKFTTTTNGNVCHIRGEKARDWTCSPSVNRELYYLFVLREEDPNLAKQEEEIFVKREGENIYFVVTKSWVDSGKLVQWRVIQNEGDAVRRSPAEAGAIWLSDYMASLEARRAVENKQRWVPGAECDRGIYAVVSTRNGKIVEARATDRPQGVYLDPDQLMAAYAFGVVAFLVYIFMAEAMGYLSCFLGQSHSFAALFW